jgi:hypothetical protein
MGRACSMFEKKKKKKKKKKEEEEEEEKKKKKKKKNAYRIVVGKPEGRIPLGRHRHR